MQSEEGLGAYYRLTSADARPHLIHDFTKLFKKIKTILVKAILVKVYTVDDKAENVKIVHQVGPCIR